MKYTALLLALPALACVTDQPSRSEGQTVEAGAFIQPTEALAREIERHVQGVRRGGSMDDFMREAEWFAGVGEPAYPTLLGMAADPDRRVSSFGYSVISALRDPRLLDTFRESVPFPADHTRQLEHVRAEVAMGDWQRLDRLIDALESEERLERGAALKALRAATGQTFGFAPEAEANERAAAVERWREWWDERSADPLLRNG